MYHNVPLKPDRYWSTFGQKLHWAALAVCAPELLTLFAVMQQNAAKTSVTEMKDFGEDLYANTGGFILDTLDCPAFPINAKSIHYPRSTGWIKPLNITKVNIWDRSKADLFTKGFTLVQTYAY